MPQIRRATFADHNGVRLSVARHSEVMNVQLWRIAAAVVALLRARRNSQPAAHLTHQPLMFSARYWNAQGKRVPPQVLTQSRDEYARLARDPSVAHYTPHKGHRHGLNKFNAEKLVDLPVSEMADAEFEPLRRPKANFLS
jgi:hypothetical protein